MKLSGLTSGFQKFFSKERVLLIGFFVLLGMLMLWYSTGKTTVRDGMSTAAPVSSSDSSKAADSSADAPGTELPHPSEIFSPAAASCEGAASGYAAQPIANPQDLLPKDANSDWAHLNPIDQSNPQMPDMLQAGYHIGLDTIGQTMKNANLQLRSDPVIPKKDVGPWNNSTYEPDMLRQPLEVGWSTSN
jgi:hypothetical protein